MQPRRLAAMLCLAVGVSHCALSRRVTKRSGGGNAVSIATGPEPGAMSPAPSLLDPAAQKQEDQLFPPTPGGLGERRLWRLTVPQLANTLRALLTSRQPLESKFDAEVRPSSGLGTESDILTINSDYTTRLASSIGPLVDQENAKLAAYLPCGAVAQITQPCLDGFISAFAGAAFRRPVTPAELQRYETVYSTLQPTSGNGEALAAVAEAILLSPYTQFRLELGIPSTDPTAVALTPYELATALAYSITNAPPDQALLAAASDGTLQTKDGRSAQVQRLLAGAGFVQGFTEFFLRYAGVAWIAGMTKDQTLFPQYTPEVMQAMVDETKAYVSSAMLEHRGDFRFLLTNQPTTVTPPLAAVYGMPSFAGTQAWTPPANERAGLFTLPGVIAANTKAADTSPVKRGVFLLNNLVCVSPPPPPPNAPTLAAQSPQGTTLRERLAGHVADPHCAACHTMIDAFGFAFEHYDPIGRYRGSDNGAVVDSSGTVAGTRFANVPFTSAVDLLATLSTAPDVHACLVRQAFRYTFGRPETAGDAPVLRSAYEHFVIAGFDIKQIFISFYSSAMFQFRKAN